ncbi:hypothetical protein WAF17_01975 [Bernardetia sp. ABR2-2B]|uniref:hypothetical protein n=1 Tax=Bernardetia sp. ABR2-2B TaxID=3127472 RepID=UPI0030D49BF5
MLHFHKLSTQEHFDFLNQERKDPITGDLIKENDEIVICSSCKSAFLKESWEYLGSTHCEQKQTLEVIPKQSKLKLKTGLLISLPLVPKEDVIKKFLNILGIEFSVLVFLFLLLKGSLFLLFLFFLTFLFPIAIGILITPITNIDLYSTYLVSKGILGKKKIEYTNIEYILINYEISSGLNPAPNNIHIKLTNRGTADMLLDKKHISNDTLLLDFVTTLARYNKVTFKTNYYYRNLIQSQNISANIELI